MKKIIALLLLAIVLIGGWSSPTFADGGYVAPTTLIITNTSTSATVKFSTNQKFKTCTILGLRSPQTTNTTMVFFGSSTNSQPYGVTPGGTVTITSQPGEFYNFSDFWLKVTTANDGLTIIYTPVP